MTIENTSETKNCGRKKGVMLAYGSLQLGTSIISAISLAALALSFCSVKNESKLFIECVEEVRGNGKSASQAVYFCNGGR
ncbi:hypothetical protein [Prochlorococcus marinus]|uniref:hypothetical protein n=1 Tax=Prochlorococcus marinus TaxID=1219 RepID=UPI0022B5D978|nr:hypothetical protein [Prochlorococcus marinus]